MSDGERRADARKWGPLALVVLGWGAALALVYRRVLVGDALFGWDCLREYWPDLVFAARALADGELPLWNPHALGGYPYWGDPQASWLAPTNWLVGAVGLVTGELGPWLIQLKVLLNMWAALVGMHLLAHRRTGSHAAAAVAAATLLLGSPLLVHKAGAFLWPLCFLPWLLLALARFVELPSARRGAAMAAAFWLVGSAGHPQGFFYSLIIFAALWAFSIAAGGVRASLRRQARGAAVFALLAAALLAPIYVPAASAVADSARAERGPDYAVASGMPVVALTELFVPNRDGYWDNDLYVGPLALVAALLALVAARSRKERAERLFLAGLAALGLALALGRAGGLLPLFAEYLPGFGLFRIAYRHRVIFAVAAALLAADGVAAVARGDGGRRAAWILVTLAAAWLVIAAAIAPRFPEFLLAAATLGTLIAAAFHRRRAHAWLAATALFALLDLWRAAAGPTLPQLAELRAAEARGDTSAAHAWHNTPHGKLAILESPKVLGDAHALVALAAAPVANRPAVANSPAVVAAPSVLPPRIPDRYFRSDHVRPYRYHVPFLHDLRELSGFLNPIAPRRHDQLVAHAAVRPKLLAHFNVRWLLDHTHTRAVFDPAPLARLFPRAELIPDGTALTHLDTGPRPSLRRAALVESGDAPAALPASDFAPVLAQLVAYRRNRVDLSVAAPAPGILVLAENYAPGWHALIDGSAVPVFRADHMLRAVVVPAGTHRISFLYKPRGHVPLLVAFATALAVLVAFAVHAARAAAAAAAPRKV